ncbi:MAG: hypothetical protein U1E77_11605 [Inhella sp.]
MPALLDRGGRAALPLHVTYGPGYNALAQRLEAQGRLTWARDAGRLAHGGRTARGVHPAQPHRGLRQRAAGYREYRFLPLTQLELLETARWCRNVAGRHLRARAVAALRAMAKEGDVAEASPATSRPRCWRWNGPPC